MLELFYFLLGAIQGLTEFLPVSSSGHMAVFQLFLSDVKKEGLLIEVTAHFGSLLAIAFYYKNTFKTQLKNKPGFSWSSIYPIFILFLSTLPAGLAGLFLRDQITGLFSNSTFIAFGFLFTSFALLLTFALSRNKNVEEMKDWPSPLGAILIGLAQAFALIPGVSRSGSTIATGILVGLKPKQSAFFSFCSVAPLIFAAAMLSLYRFVSHAERLTQSENPLNLGVLLVSSFFFSWFGLSLVIRFLEKNKLHYFAAYLVPLACLLLIWG